MVSSSSMMMLKTSSNSNSITSKRLALWSRRRQQLTTTSALAIIRGQEEGGWWWQQQQQMAVVTAAAAVSVVALLDKAAQCEENKSSTTTFQIMAALEVKEELEKVRLAQLMYDLQQQQAAKNNNNAGATGGLMRRYVTGLTSTGPNKMQRKKTVPFGTLGHMASANVSGGDITADFGESVVTPALAQSLIKAIQAGGKLSRKSLLSLVEAAQFKLQAEPSLIDLSRSQRQAETVTVIGDLHGNLDSLNSVLELIHLSDLQKQRRTLVFDGNFVNRGHNSLQVIGILLLLKLAYPKQVYLLRGNHEDDLIASVYGFRDEITEKYGRLAADEIWKSLTDLFASLPLAAKTKHAAIWHGGLPGKYFKLEQIAAISEATRSGISSPAVIVDDAVSQLAQTLLWSDPNAAVFDIAPSPRGCGVCFGPAVARDFLERHDLHYLVRSHELTEHGVSVMDCGDNNKKVITVFSAAGYPDGHGSNKGAVVHLNQQDGSYTVSTFGTTTGDETALQGKSATERGLRAQITSHKHRLEAAFQKHQDMWGTVSPSQWADIMSHEMEMENVPWETLQTSMAPKTGSLLFGKGIDWKKFLKENVSETKFAQDSPSAAQSDELHANHQMLLTVFKFLDQKGTGFIELNDFKAGLKLLNEHVPKNRQLSDADALFKLLDTENKGKIDIKTFQRAFTTLA